MVALATGLKGARIGEAMLRSGLEEGFDGGEVFPEQGLPKDHDGGAGGQGIKGPPEAVVVWAHCNQLMVDG
jgi:hypothetical protein